MNLRILKIFSNIYFLSFDHKQQNTTNKTNKMTNGDKPIQSVDLKYDPDEKSYSMTFSDSESNSSDIDEKKSDDVPQLIIITPASRMNSLVSRIAHRLNQRFSMSSRNNSNNTT